MKLSDSDREQAVLLLRCAADLVTRGNTYSFSIALTVVGATKVACSAARDAYAEAYWPACAAGFFDYHTTLLEAAQLLDDD